jgi:hypothetical protein
VSAPFSSTIPTAMAISVELRRAFPESTTTHRETRSGHDAAWS